MIESFVEKKITEFCTSFFKYVLFFLNNNQQSLIVSLLHYIIIIFGFYYFLFHSKKGDLYRIIFFIIITFGALSYFILNKCIITSIELKLSEENNLIQNIVNKYFGEEIEGNIMSKIVLSLLAMITSIILLKDYGFL